LKTFLLAGAATLAFALSAQASPVLLARGELSGSTGGPNADLSGLTGKLENGAPANLLGGLGSGIAWAGGSIFLAMPDRGPNAVKYNAKVDDTSSYIDRFHTLTLALVPAKDAALPFALTPVLTKTTLLFSAEPLAYGSGEGLGVPPGAPAQNTGARHYFTGRSDNYTGSSSADPKSARFDPEGVRVSSDGKFVFVSDEYGPYLRQFDRATGRLLKTFALPADLAVARQSPHGKTEISDNASGRTANKGLEGLAITPDGRTLVAMMQAAVLQDASDPTSAKLLRIVAVDIAGGGAREYGYLLTTGKGVSELVAVNNHEFLVDERDSKGLGDDGVAKAKHLFRIDIAGAKDITGLKGAAAAASPVKKSAAPVLDLVALLGAHGVAPDKVPAKIEGLAFGPDVTWQGKTLHALYITNDNDFVPDESGPNQVFVVGFDDADLPGFEPQTIGR
jgi:hypothetical protein